MAASARTAPKAGGKDFLEIVVITKDDIGHASGPILAGFLIARYDYLYAFWFMAALLVLAVPVFVMNVKISRA